ncbi:hypothetical protein GCM10023116_44190 [Kistimonas scapharcae]|uniref:Uncharacterized protein n=1 Tax=Kistimonas scapharcae TaxID=1036133 RepID=A0ABP8VA30_9GAMM
MALARDLSLRNTFNALPSGIIANHAVAVLGAARCDGEDGVLIRDPYGAKINNNGEVQLSDGQSLGWRQGDDGIQFIPWRQFPHYFNMAVEVRDRGKSVMPVELSSSSVHETSSAVVDLEDDDLSDIDTSLL